MRTLTRGAHNKSFNMCQIKGGLATQLQKFELCSQRRETMKEAE